MFSRLGAFWSGSRPDYLPLPSFSPDAVRSEVASRARRIVRQRHFKLFILLILLASVGLLWNSGYIIDNISRLQIEPIDPLHPPLYEEYEALERGLPQHNASLPFPEGSNGRYFFPADHVWGMLV